MKIKGVGKVKSAVIIAYCGSFENAAKKGSLLYKAHLPWIGRSESERIWKEIQP